MNKSNHLPTTEVPIRFFTWNNPTRTLSVELSDLEAINVTLRKLTQPLYNDACDVGFSIVGKHKTLRFVYMGCGKDADGDITHWGFRTEFAPGKAPEPTDITVIIFND